MGTPRSKNVSSDIASYVEDSKLNEQICFYYFFMVVQHMLMVAQHMLLVVQPMLMVAQHMLLVVQHMLRVVQHMCNSVRIKSKLKLSLITSNILKRNR